MSSNQTKKIQCKKEINQQTQPIKWEKVFINYAYDKELVSKYIKNQNPQYKTLRKNFIEKYAKDLN